jgi:hypothetical protein
MPNEGRAQPGNRRAVKKIDLGLPNLYREIVARHAHWGPGLRVPLTIAQIAFNSKCLNQIGSVCARPQSAILPVNCRSC